MTEPTKEDLASPLFNAVWDAIKCWDVSRDGSCLYHGTTGTDVMAIVEAVRPFTSDGGPASQLGNPNAELLKRLRAYAELAEALGFISDAADEIERLYGGWSDANLARLKQGLADRAAIGALEDQVDALKRALKDRTDGFTEVSELVAFWRGRADSFEKKRSVFEEKLDAVSQADAVTKLDHLLSENLRLARDLATTKAELGRQTGNTGQSLEDRVAGLERDVNAVLKREDDWRSKIGRLYAEMRPRSI